MLRCSCLCIIIGKGCSLTDKLIVIIEKVRRTVPILIHNYSLKGAIDSYKLNGWIISRAVPISEWTRYFSSVQSKSGVRWSFQTPIVNIGHGIIVAKRECTEC